MEFRENNVYQVTAHYVEVDGKPKVMELIQYLDEADIARYRRKRSGCLQIKLERVSGRALPGMALTGIYNRRYYEDQLAQTDSAGWNCDDRSG